VEKLSLETIDRTDSFAGGAMISEESEAYRLELMKVPLNAFEDNAIWARYSQYVRVYS
jgi:hypothetical protein